MDFFDGATGKLLHQHMDKGCDNKIISLNLFNQTGDALLSSAGMYVCIFHLCFSHLEEKRLDRKYCLLLVVVLLCYLDLEHF